MISALCFVPAGRADPNPKKYELSGGETNMLKQTLAGDDPMASSTSTTEQPPPPPKTASNASTILPLVNINDMPNDLRMDDYDKEPNQVHLVGSHSEVVGTSLDASGIPQEEIIGESEDDDMVDEDQIKNGGAGTCDVDDSDSRDDEMSDDDYDPLMHDPREYEPTDTAALTAMGLGHTSTHPKQGFYFGNEDSDGEPEEVSEERGT